MLSSLACSPAAAVDTLTGTRTPKQLAKKKGLASPAKAKKKREGPGHAVILRKNENTTRPSKFGQRLTALRVPQPSLLLLYHIEKTGGSSVFRWLQRQMREPPRLTALFAYGQTSCFFSMHADLFPKMSYRWRSRQCGGEQMPDWRTARVAVQFHSYSKGFFNDIVLPALPQLRARYAAAGGRVVTTTVLREPSSYLFSKYMMWPPHDKATGHVIALPLCAPASRTDLRPSRTDLCRRRRRLRQRLLR